MIRWELTDAEQGQLRGTLEREAARLGDIVRAGKANPKSLVSAENRKTDIERLLRSLVKAKETTEEFDLVCYCDTNYNFYAKTMSTSYRIGDNETVHHEERKVMQPPPDEYLGILCVLQELKNRGTKGRVRVISDAARCTLALQMGLRYKVPNHSENQSSRSSNFGESYDAAIALTKQLLGQGCRVEFTHKHRNFINEALKIGG